MNYSQKSICCIVPNITWDNNFDLTTWKIPETTKKNAGYQFGTNEPYIRALFGIIDTWKLSFSTEFPPLTSQTPTEKTKQQSYIRL